MEYLLNGFVYVVFLSLVYLLYVLVVSIVVDCLLEEWEGGLMSANGARTSSESGTQRSLVQQRNEAQLEHCFSGNLTFQIPRD